MSFSVKKCTHWCFFLYQVNFVCPSCVVKSVFKKEVECVKKNHYSLQNLDLCGKVFFCM